MEEGHSNGFRCFGLTRRGRRVKMPVGGSGVLRVCSAAVSVRPHLADKAKTASSRAESVTGAVVTVGLRGRNGSGIDVRRGESVQTNSNFVGDVGQTK